MALHTNLEKSTTKQSIAKKSYGIASIYSPYQKATDTEKSRTLLRRLSYANNIVRICIKIIKGAVVQTPFVITTKPGYEPDDYVDEIAYLTRLLQRPNNQDDTYRTIFNSIIDDVLVLNNGVVEKVRNRLGEVIELFYVDGATIYENRDDKGYFKNPAYKQYLSSYDGHSDTEPDAVFDMEDLLIFQDNASHGNDNLGKSTLDSIIQSVVSLLEATTYNTSYFGDTNLPPGLLNLRGPESEDLDAIKVNFDAQVRENIHRTLFTNAEDIKHIQLRPNNQDMQFAELYEKMIQIVVSGFGLSIQDVGLISDVNRATAEVQSNVSKNRGVASMMALIKEEIQYDLIDTDLAETVSRFGALQFEFSAQDKLDELTEAQVDKIYLDAGLPGYQTRLIREKGLEKDMQTEEEREEEVEEEGNKVEEEQEVANDQEEDDNDEEIHKAYTQPERGLSPEERRVDFDTIEEQLSLSEDVIITSIEDVVNKQVERVKNEINQSVRNEDVSQASQITFSGAASTLSTVQRQLRGVSNFAEVMANAELQQQNDLQKQVDNEELSEVESEKSVNIAFTKLNENIEFYALEAVSGDYSQERVNEDVDSIVNKFFNTTVALLATSLVMTVFNRKRKEVFDIDDSVTGYRYSAVMDNRTTDYCRSLDNRVFDKASAAEVMPPNHFRCRSILVPIIKPLPSDTTPISDVKTFAGLSDFKDVDAIKKSIQERIDWLS